MAQSSHNDKIMLETYLNFDLLLDRAANHYKARVLESPAGDATEEFSLPFSELQLENYLLKLGAVNQNTRRIRPQQDRLAQEFGSQLFQAIFKDSVLQRLSVSQAMAQKQDAGLRLRLRLGDEPILAQIPWEFLYNQARNEFFALSKQTPLVRYPDMDRSIRPLSLPTPLRILLMLSNAQANAPLNVVEEEIRLRQPLSALTQAGSVEITRLPAPTLDALQTELARRDYHILHYVGHGDFDAGRDEGVLYLQDRFGQPRAVSGQELGVMLQGYNLRLAVLNACLGAQMSSHQPFSGVAQSLVQIGLPAVVAMQFEISDGGALVFAQRFYESLARGWGVDVATVEGRLALFAEGGLEWGTPVIYLRADDGRIFQPQRQPPFIPPEEEPAYPSPPEPVRCGIPSSLTPLIGREAEIGQIVALLPSKRLITLTGPGGVGKTRLAEAVAKEAESQYRDGVCYTELAHITGSNKVAQAIAARLDVREEPGIPIRDTLQRNLSQLHSLLILDNCEHLIEECADIVMYLLRNCPYLRIVATSQQRLGLVGEELWPVSALMVPDLDWSLSHEGFSTDAFSRFSAIHLFIERARAVNRAFSLTPQNAPYIVQICRQLDGIPLAIELAAAWVRTLPLELIAEQIEKFLYASLDGPGAIPSRHRSLRALFDWSYNLLSAEEQKLFRSLAVYAGGWTLEAVRQINFGANIETWQILSALTALIDKSLVSFDTLNARGRYRFLSPVQIYAQDRLRTHTEERSYCERHCRYFLSLAEAGDAHLLGSDQESWFAILEDEHHNLRAALEWCKQNNLSEDGLRISAALWRFWRAHGYMTEGRKYLDYFLDHTEVGSFFQASEERERKALRTRALNALGNLALNQGDLAQAEAYYNRVLKLRQELNDTLGVANIYCNLGLVSFRQGEYERAREQYERSLPLQQSEQNEDGISAVMCHLGLIEHVQGNLDAARKYYEENLRLCRKLDNKSSIAYALCNLARLCLDVGRIEEADGTLRESLAILVVLDDKWQIAYALEARAQLVFLRQEFARTAFALGVAARIREEIHSPLPHNLLASHHQVVEQSRSVMGAETFDLYWKQGYECPAGQALRQILAS